MSVEYHAVTKNNTILPIKRLKKELLRLVLISVDLGLSDCPIYNALMSKRSASVALSYTLYSQIGRFYGNILAAKDASMLPLNFFVQCVTVIYYTVTYRKPESDSKVFTGISCNCFTVF